MCSTGKKKELVIAKKIENVFFIVLLIVVLGLFTIPIIVYYRATSVSVLLNDAYNELYKSDILVNKNILHALCLLICVMFVT